MLTFFTVLAGAIAILLVAASFADREFTVTRKVIVEFESQFVFDYLRHLNNHVTFSKWSTKDPDKRVAGRGVDGTRGYVLRWHNYPEKAGIGEMTIVDIDEGTQIAFELRYFKPVKGFAKVLFTMESVGKNMTEVQWQYTGVSNYPLNLLTTVMNMDNIVGNDLESGLRKLKLALLQV